MQDWKQLEDTKEAFEDMVDTYDYGKLKISCKIKIPQSEGTTYRKKENIVKLLI
jgi:hypothetical protein